MALDPHCNSPVDYLELVWPASLVDLVASETNRHAVEKGGYWIRPFMTFFDYAVNNAFILYKHNCLATSTVEVLGSLS